MVYPQLRVTGDVASIGALLDGLKAGRARRWRLDRELDGATQLAGSMDTGLSVLLQGQVDPQSEGLVQLSLTTVHGVDGANPSLADVEAAFDQFAKDVASLAARERLDVTIQRQPTEPTIDNYLGWPQVRELLDQFTRQVNPASGARDANDRERWFAFVFACHKTTQQVSPRVLAQHLQGCGFDPVEARQLSEDFETLRHFAAFIDSNARRFLGP